MKIDYSNLPKDYYCDFGDFFYSFSLTKHFTIMKAPHYHNSYEIYFMLSGNLVYILDGMRVELQQGDVLVINPYVLHKTMGKNENHERVLINFSTNWLLEYFSNEVTDSLLSVFTKKMHFKFSERDLKNVQKILYNLSFETQKYNSNKIQLYLGEFLLYIAENATPVTNNNTESKGSKVGKTITEYINKHQNEKITIDSLSKNLYISKSTIYNILKKEYQMTPHVFIEYLRMKNAKFLLLTSEFSLKKIAKTCGYSSQITFSRVFKKYFAISPTAFKKELEESGRG